MFFIQFEPKILLTLAPEYVIVSEVELGSSLRRDA